MNQAFIDRIRVGNGCFDIHPIQIMLVYSVDEKVGANRIIFFSISIAFITGNSSLEPLLEGLCAQIHVNLSCRVFGRNRTGNT